jgi:acylglycerol lipase
MDPPDVAKLRTEFQAPHELVRASDGKVLFLRHWVGTGRSDLAVLLLHGITAYSEPYGRLLAEDLARVGFDVFGLDLRGHGRSDGIRGDLPGGDRFQKDLCETVAFVKTRFPRVVLWGHSLGVISAMVAVQGCGPSIDGVVLLSGGRRIRPGVYSKPTARAALRNLLAITLFRTRPWIEYSRRGMMGRDDPLFNFRYSARFYSAVYGMSPAAVARMLRRHAIDSPYLTPPTPLRVPVLVAVGDQDELFSVESSRELFDTLPANRKEFLVIPGGHHASFPPGAWDPFADWLRRQFAPAAGAPSYTRANSPDSAGVTPKSTN